MGTPLSVLIIEDSEEDTQLLLRELGRNGYEVEFERVETGGAMRAMLSEKEWDLILSDYTLPKFSAPQALEILKISGLDIPFIILSGTIGEETAVAALKAGANDFLVKGKFARLGPAVERELREAEIHRDRKRAQDQNNYHARLLRHISDAVIATDDQFRITAWNRAAETTYGWTAQEVMGRSVIEILRSGLNDAQQAEASELLEMSSYRSERIHSKKNGQPVYVEENTIALSDEHGRITGFVSVNRDITQRRQAENKLVQHVERLTALREIDRAITSTTDVNINLGILLSQSVSVLNIDAADVLLINPGLNALEYTSGLGFRSTIIKNAHIRLGEGLAGRAALTPKIIHVPNLSREQLHPFYRPLVEDEGFVEYAAMSLVSKGKVLGVLEAYQRSPSAFDADKLHFLETLAGQAAIAIDTAQTFEGLQRSNMELMMAYDATIAGWSHAMDLRDKETEGHTQRVTELTLKLAERFGIGHAETLQIRRGALLHDIGKLGVPDSILLKPSKLTDEEWVIMKRHTEYAFEMLSSIVYLRPAIDIPYCHHEKWDGSGYPQGLKGEQIPLAARLFSVVDVWDALTSDRPYRPGWSREKTIEYIREQSGKHFDPHIVESFLLLIQQV